MEVNVAALQYAYLNLVYRLFLNKLLLEIIQSAQTTSLEPNHTQGERYRYITDGNDALGTHTATSESTGTTRYTGINVTLYGRGEAVAMNYTASTGSRGGAAYLGKDILGSVRSTSNEYGLLEDRYEYDAFGKPYKGKLSAGMNLGYTGKPYDVVTGLYNYGYRDYQPVNAGFTTVDPIRDGNNWVVYVNNDPVNWVDPLGLSASDKGVAILKYAQGGLDLSVAAEVAGVKAEYAAQQPSIPIQTQYLNEMNTNYTAQVKTLSKVSNVLLGVAVATGVYDAYTTWQATGEVSAGVKRLVRNTTSTLAGVVVTGVVTTASTPVLGPANFIAGAVIGTFTSKAVDEAFKRLGW